jgi:hypothetical protein
MWEARHIHQALAATGARHARNRGLGKARLQHVFSAVALNLIRLDAYWNDHSLDRTEPATSPTSSPLWPHDPR